MNAPDINREELINVLYDDLLKMLDGFKFGSISLNLTIHNGLIARVDLSETRNTRMELKK